MNKTRISYVTHAANPVRGCSPAGAGCANCWSASLASRFGDQPGTPWHPRLARDGKWTGEVRFNLAAMLPVLRARKPGVVFVCSQSDLFHPDVTDEQIAAVYGVMAACPQHRFLVLTKRWVRMRTWFGWVENRPLPPVARCVFELGIIVGEKAGRMDFPAIDFGDPPWPLDNVWLGVSAWDQESANEAVGHVLACPAAHRWLSLEPCLGPVNLERIGATTSEGMWRLDALRGALHKEGRNEPTMGPRLDLVIQGGESGPNARPCDVAWIRDVVRQCKAAGTSVYVKQLGSHAVDLNAAARTRLWPTLVTTERLPLRDRAGADISEFPVDLRVRDLPWRTT